MKLIIFDVGNAACAIVSSPNNYGMMMDCGSHSEKPNPIDKFSSNKEWLGTESYYSNNQEYDIGLLHITHPDDDHVRNAKKLKEELPPCLVCRREYENFPIDEQINEDYKKFIDKGYRGDPQTIDWGFDTNKIFEIPMEILKRNDLLNKKLKNNSSILRYISYQGFKILFTGDMEKEGWEWLSANDKDFSTTVQNGVDILIAPHHGHKSGFPNALFDLSGKVQFVIHSKGSEGNIDGTDVSSQYSKNAEGINYKNLNDKNYYSGSVLTTRSNGDIYIDISNFKLSVWTDKASPNHFKI